VGLTWESFSASAQAPDLPDSVDPRIRQVYEGLSLDAKFDAIAALARRQADYERRYRTWYEENYAALSDRQIRNAGEQHRRQIADLARERSDRLNAVIDLVTASADPRPREPLKEKLIRVFEARALIRDVLQKKLGRPVILRIKANPRELVAAVKAEGKSSIDLILLSGSAAFESAADRSLQPLVVGALNRSQIEQGFPYCLQISLPPPENAVPAKGPAPVANESHAEVTVPAAALWYDPGKVSVESIARLRAHLSQTGQEKDPRMPFFTKFTGIELWSLADATYSSQFAALRQKIPVSGGAQTHLLPGVCPLPPVRPSGG
jgi:hypothetical protein